MLPLLFVALLALALSLVVALGGRPGAPRSPDAEREAETLRARHARGEIDSAEFNRRLRELDARR